VLASRKARNGLDLERRLLFDEPFVQATRAAPREHILKDIVHRIVRAVHISAVVAHQQRRLALLTDYDSAFTELLRLFRSHWQRLFALG